MQFYLNGYHAGDSHVQPQAPDAMHAPSGDDVVDVLVVGGGPAGLVLGASLAQFPEISTMLVDKRRGPLELGQADGVACRTIEMFEAFGFAYRVLEESYWVNEVVFWRPDPAEPSRIVRNGRVRDVEDGLSEMPHVILNQGRIHEFLTDCMANGPARLAPRYGTELVSLEQVPGDSHPVHVTIRDAEGATSVVRARYVVGCDGARSSVRRSFGAELRGDSANQAWGVMDALLTTDFPDIRFKAVVQSAEHGNMLIIPREGGYLVRFYIELGELAEGERARDRTITADDLIAAARRVIAPHDLEVKEVVWWSVYEIGQRVAEAFDNSAQTGGVPNVFVAGDACHTHSPKAGQGMNVSMQDTFNLGWKLAAVLRGQAPESLLSTYEEERRGVAQGLIDFDRTWAGMMSAQAGATGVTPEALQRQFSEQGRYTAGFGTKYAPSVLTAAGARQEFATGLPLGERFHSSPVVRVADGKHVQLGHAARADGRWRLYLFGDACDIRSPESALAAACGTLEATLIARFTPTGVDVDEVFDVRGVLQQSHHEVDVSDLPALLAPSKGRYGLTDYEKTFTAVVGGPDIYDTRGISRDGCIVAVRPDQYIAHVLPLDAAGSLPEFFEGFLLPVA
ncbi:3-hydroxybenzoate 4-monooxygenase [Salinibacterium sp. dk2585]|uniref:FAD-dependent monooxygenase n=1 Tax=unclassified Salinibacterium TaxID=2632331 RepID=UPI0011C24B6E|nr:MULTISPECIES: FAD-dependent monooxygenase [unclassified Salinibacterium]QEE60235.1 3-hydroxybenzoate 4-monooxygenase [Salinibacterium sp. dk2585]TXK55307.1 3-hydroxybenzoate 4-monooxygenase [Salinibacterium sp. dk5596]